MKKKSLFMALAALFVLAFASCNNEPEITGPGIDDGGNDSVPEVVGPDATPITVAEFLAAPESKDVYYELTGVIGGSINETYGNFDLTDETGTVYVYGLTATYQANGKNDQSYASLGLKAGDNITIRGYRGSYNDKVEVMGAFFVKKNSSGTGGGSDNDKETALTVSEAIAKQDQSIMWVKGYIVGGVNPDESANSIKDASGVIFAAEGVRPSAIVIAETKEEKDYTKCLVIGFGSDSNDAKAVLNLVDNPSNLGKEVFLKGKLINAFGVPGMKTITEFDLEGYEAPEIDFNVPVMEIADLRAMYSGSDVTVSESKKIVGVVTSDLEGGNSTSLKNLIVTSEDNTAGIAVRLTENNTYAMGDKIEITLNGLKLSDYGQVIQLNNVPVANVRKVGTATITPKAITIADIINNYAMYESCVVSVKGTITPASGTTFGSSSQHASNTLSDGSNSITLFVAKYAKFVNETVPSGEKTVTGIVGRFTDDSKDELQLTMRNMNDIK